MDELTQSLHINIKKEQQQVLDTIRDKLPPDVTLLHVSVVGSRAKRLANERSSDYDTKVVVMHDRDAYLLQIRGKNWSFSTHTPDGVEVESSIIDLLTLYRYILETNMMAHETLAGIPLYTTTVIEDVKDLWRRAYQASTLQRSYNGMLGVYARKNLSNSQTTILKAAAEMIYLALTLRFIQTYSAEPPPFSAFAVLQRMSEDEWIQEQQTLLLQLFEERRTGDKTAPYKLSDALMGLIDMVIGAEKVLPNAADKGKLKEEAHTYFLKLVG